MTALRLENDRDGAVVDELDGHAGAEDAARDPDVLCLEGRAEPFVERLSVLGARGLREARPVALRRIPGTSEVNRKIRETR